MKKIFLIGGFFGFVMSFGAYAADGLVRITCDDADAGAEVTIDGKVFGKCSSDSFTAFVTEGEHQLRVRKSKNFDEEQVFESKIVVDERVPVRLSVSLSAPRLTTDALRRRNIAEANAQIKGAENGDVISMRKLADYYDAGMGVEKNASKAKEWRAKALEQERLKVEGQYKAEFQEQLALANSGNVGAMKKVAEYYGAGRGVGKNSVKSVAWLDAATQATFDASLHRAEAGDIAAMKVVAGWYGNSTWKGADASKEKYWNEKIDVTNNERLAQEKALKIQAKLKDLRFFNVTSVMLNPNTRMNDGRLAKEAPFFMSGVYTSAPIWTVVDLMSLPFLATKRQMIKNEAAMRPSAWAKPDSMMARASVRSGQGSIFPADEVAFVAPQ